MIELTTTLILWGLLVVYIFYYVSQKVYLRRETFQGSAPEKKEKSRVVMEYTNPPYETRGIYGLADYAEEAVYQNESDRELSESLRNKLMSQYPMDWSGYPTSSSQFQAGYSESFTSATRTVPDNPKPYDAVSGVNMYPPDTEKAEGEERRLLQTYNPTLGGDMTTYDIQDAKQLIENIYAAKGLIPTVAHEKDTNVYEIVGVRRKDEKVLYEDEEAPASRESVEQAGESTIIVPTAAADLAATKDPYYDVTGPGGKTRMNKWDYASWTPGLERMFAPTNGQQNWY